MRTLVAFALAAAFGLCACIQDLEGGAARLQVRNTWSDTVRSVSIGEWTHDFVPRLAPGMLSETVELPVSGQLDVGVWGVRDGRDTLLTVRRIDAGVGEFKRLE